MPPRLISLELQGYKTFASRNAFEFPAKITAIVGPNGAGKSNIADSLRWVLGEQTFSILRGRKTEDMIFSGSDKRPKASMAMATVNFDNTDGWLPIDYSVVSIARRAYRDGQNEYLLNNQRVRLKEISELLASSGLAERTYTIIGQGLVDTALSLKPDERRKFFEEAAGIGLYRARKDEAEHRLDATRRNTERVQDILLELEPRLHSLEKQAVRAKEYRRVQADLRLLLHEWYGFYWYKTQDELTHARQALNTNEKRFDEARKHLMEVEEDSREIREEMQRLRGSLSQWHSDLSSIHQERERVSRELAILEERQNSLNAILASSKVDEDRIIQELQTKRYRLSRLEQELAKVRSEDEEIQATVAGVKERYQKQLIIQGTLEQKIRNTRKELTATETKKLQLSMRLTEIDEQKTSIENGIIKVKEDIEFTRQEIDRFARSRQAAEKDLNDLETGKEIIDRDLMVTQEMVEGQRQKERALVTERANQQSSLARLTARLEMIELAERTLVGMADGTKNFIDRLQTTQWSGKAVPLSQHITVMEGYEKSISAALGDLMDALVIESGLDLDSAFMLVKENALSRVAIIDPGLIRPSIEQGGKSKQPANILGEPADFIQADDATNRILVSIFENVYIVENLDNAREAVAQSRRSQKFITLDGDVVTANGWVLSGTDPRSAVVARPRELQKINAELNSVTKKLEPLNDQLSREKQSIDAGLEKLGQLKRTGLELQDKIKHARQVVQEIHLAGSQMDQKMTILLQQVKDLESQLLQLDDKKKEATNELQTVRIALEQQRIAERETLGTLNEQDTDDLEQEVSHWETKLAVGSQMLHDLEQRLIEQRDLISADQAQLQSLSKRIKSTEVSQQEAQEARHQLREKEIDISKKIGDLQTQIQPAERELDQNEQRSIDAQSKLLSVQQSVTSAERYASQAQMELLRQREALDSMRRKIEDDFGLVDLEYTAEVEGPSLLPIDGIAEPFAKVAQLPDGLDENINRLRGSLRRMGVVNLEAQNEYEQVNERFEFLTTQIADLRKADLNLRQVITELDDLMKVEFKKTFDVVAVEFKEMFIRLFGGGSAKLILLDEENPIEAGIEIEAKLPGRREQGLSLLSGGERSLTAVALIFSLLKVSPTPFCVLDEVDAMLDEANVGRFGELLRELSQTTQFIIITHNRNTVQIADVIYGVTMGRDSVSQVISLRLDEVSDEMVA